MRSVEMKNRCLLYYGNPVAVSYTHLDVYKRQAEDLAHPTLVSDLDFHNIIYATMIARYGKAVMDASKEAPEWAMC